MQPVAFKDKAGKALIKKLTVPRNPTKGNPDLRLHPWTAPLEFAQFYEYCKQDVRAEIAVSDAMPEMSPRELRLWLMDQRINARGLPIDLKAVNACIVIVEQAMGKYNAEIRALTHGAVESYSKAADMMRWLATRSCYVENLDEEAVETELAKQHPADVLRVLKLRALLSFGCVKKLYAMRAQTCADGRLRDQYSFHSAHTSLWNGRDIQVMNLYKGSNNTPEEIEAALAVIATGSLEYVELVYGDALECVANCLRSMICAPLGSTLISADFTAIQAVVTSALAGEKWRLDVFHTHGKIYESMAAMLTGKSLDYYLQYRKENGKHHPDRQTYGKIPVLASDFGAWVGGWVKFGAAAFGDEKAIKEMILRTRRQIPNIVEMWGGQTRNKFNKAPDGSYAPERPELYGLEGAAIAAVQNPGTCFGHRQVRYMMVGDVLYCQPPGDGAPLQYHAPRLNKARREWASPWELDLSYEGWNTKDGGSWLRMPLYGGVLTQNVVAKVAREFQADTLLALDEHPSGNYPVVGHTHDEQIVETVHGTSEEYLRIARAAVLKPWAVDDEGRPWPIKLPGAEVTQRYGKWE